jgi:hypothetical protein
MNMIVSIAEAVKDAINSATFSQAVAAERYYQPLFELKDMKDLKASVVPNAISSVNLGRGRVQHDVRIDVAVQKKLQKGDNAEIDPLMDLVEEIDTHFQFKRLDGFSNAAWVKTENVPIYAQEHMAEMRQFTSVLTLTFRVIK